MKTAIRGILEKIHRVEPDASFGVELWDGESFYYGDRPTAVLQLKSGRSAQKLLQEGFLGFGESYMQGDLDVEGDLQELLRLGLAIRYDYVEPGFWQKLRLLPRYWMRRGAPRRARQNIAHHYDLGDELYGLYLDPSLTYSCAYFRNDDMPLEEAQTAKYDHIARKLMLKPGESLVDVGCGWGGMLIHAAQHYGVTGVGNTLSGNQHEHANRRIGELGLRDRIQVVLRDYREMEGRFDKFVSIGMFEHVGKQFLPLFMERVARLLKKGGVGLLHTIGKDRPSSIDLWTMRYIFPGAYIPSLPEITARMGDRNLCVLDVENLRLHYARTLDCWAANFERNAGKVRERFGESFTRMWRLYLNASSAAFKHGELRLYQILFSNGLNNDLPLTRDHCYGERCG